MENKPSSNPRMMSPGHRRKKAYDDEMQFATLEDGTRVQTHWRMDVYATEQDRKRLAEIAEIQWPKMKGRKQHLGRKHLIRHLLERYDAKREIVTVEVELPRIGDLRWLYLAQDLAGLMESSRQIDPSLLRELAWRLNDFVADAE